MELYQEFTRSKQGSSLFLHYNCSRQNVDAKQRYGDQAKNAQNFYPQLLIVNDDILKLGDMVLNSSINNHLRNTALECKNLQSEFKRNYSFNEASNFTINTFSTDGKCSNTGKVINTNDRLVTQLGENFELYEKSIRKTVKLGSQYLNSICDRDRESQLKTQWVMTDCCVQGHVFNDQYELQNQSLIRYLMQNKHRIITISHFKQLMHFLRVQTMYYHFERGLKLNSQHFKSISQNGEKEEICIRKLMLLESEQLNQIKECVYSQIFSITPISYLPKVAFHGESMLDVRKGRIMVEEENEKLHLLNHRFILDHHIFDLLASQDSRDLQGQNKKKHADTHQGVDLPIFWARAPKACKLFVYQSEKTQIQSQRGHFRRVWSDQLNKLETNQQSGSSQFSIEMEPQVPKPDNHRNFCKVCNIIYPEYYKHIKSNDHLLQVRTPDNMVHLIEIDKLIADLRIAKFAQRRKNRLAGSKRLREDDDQILIE
ncbi:hypothetical protein FGO68_gene9153 [Halteria grandinella]|uniref:DBF4-type domain-containing protein n=1 Tax=Halteria grandinella TaxID=5974 RepID=A0A8J8P5F8_HALGN|nr:hypothetical protein FGO68_gene9153 [Halteria grandinella]